MTGLWHGILSAVVIMGACTAGGFSAVLLYLHSTWAIPALLLTVLGAFLIVRLDRGV